MKKLVVGINDFVTKCPEFLSEWDYKKNNELGIYPDKLYFNSEKKVWWKCNICGHEWITNLYSRNRGTGCPECAKKRVAYKKALPKEGESLQDKYPELMKEWNYKKNGNLLPSQVRCGSDKYVWWKCKHGHEWQSRISHRTGKKTGCPVCAGQKVVAGFNDLATKFPELVKEWNYEKNNGLLPTQVPCGSHRKVWWRCNQGHEWEASLADRTRGNKCPYCGGKKVLAGFNDFEFKFPLVAKEWHPTKNGDLKPNMFTWCSGKKVWWLCPVCGHEWQTSISHRSSRGTGCPKCSSVHSTSFSEQAVFYYLKRYFSDALNRHKLSDNNGLFEVDVYLPSIKVAVEYDGDYWHRKRVTNDKNKEKRLKKLKIKLYRVLESRENKIVSNCIYYDFYHDYYANLNWAIKSLLAMLGCGTLFVDEQIDEQEISNVFYTTETKNSLASRYPELVKEWNYEKNGFLLPTMVKPFSDRKVWWKCKVCGHEWLSTVGNRSIGEGCLACARKKNAEKYSIPKEGCSLAEKFPDIVKEWHPFKNGDLLPTQVSFGSRKKVWWKCNECGHEWQAVISSRRRCGCPECGKRKSGESHKIPKPGKSLQDKFPELLKEWDYKKNGSLLPSQFKFASNEKVWWKCSQCGYEWQTAISCRTSGRKSGCPQCGKQRKGRPKKSLVMP